MIPGYPTVCFRGCTLLAHLDLVSGGIAQKAVVLGLVPTNLFIPPRKEPCENTEALLDKKPVDCSQHSVYFLTFLLLQNRPLLVLGKSRLSLLGSLNLVLLVHDIRENGS